MKIETIKPAKGFKYDDSPQRSPTWLEIRAPRVGASELGALMGKGKRGDYLAARKTLLRELAFQKAFGVPFSKFTNAAMQAGIDNEDFVATEYATATGVELEKVGCFYNDYFVASPDRKIKGVNGGVEIKWLFDTSWAEVVETGAPRNDHYLQMQGQMAATGWDFVDYVAANGNTGKFIVIRITRSNAVVKEILDEVKVVKEVEPMQPSDGQIFSFNAGVPESTKDTGENPWN